MSDLLVLFDIDLTLIRSNGIGYHALNHAGQHAFGPECSAEGIPFGGQLDPLIFDMMLTKAGLDPTPERRGLLREAYLEDMRDRLAHPRAGIVSMLPGVSEVVAAFEREPGVTLGLLTGNLEESGTLKLRAAGIEAARFPVRVWGDDSPHDPPDRAHLPPVGMARHETLGGPRLAPDQVVIIGDTTHDVRAARENGCRSLAVATGRDDADTLKAAGATLAVSDLSDTRRVVDWVIGR